MECLEDIIPSSWNVSSCKDYLSERILDERLVGDQIKEADSGPVERQDVLRGPEILELSVDSANLSDLVREKLSLAKIGSIKPRVFITTLTKCN